MSRISGVYLFTSKEPVLKTRWQQEQQLVPGPLLAAYICVLVGDMKPCQTEHSGRKISDLRFGQNG